MLVGMSSILSVDYLQAASAHETASLSVVAQKATDSKVCLQTDPDGDQV